MLHLLFYAECFVKKNSGKHSPRGVPKNIFFEKFLKIYWKPPVTDFRKTESLFSVPNILVLVRSVEVFWLGIFLEHKRFHLKCIERRLMVSWMNSSLYGEFDETFFRAYLINYSSNQVNDFSNWLFNIMFIRYSTTSSVK